MIAVIETGGKQYKISEGDTINVEKLNVPVGESITLKEVLLVGEGDQIQTGTPYLENYVVKGEVTRQYKDRKIIVFKKHRRKNYRRKNGHRQNLTQLKITEISNS